ncbi:hypothetical protein F511_11349 [Dorcoceras hygrometricum]|uniref:Uncharacterized protein n=1 Tax=Dorcoceras hygrometricum TaxID=472368 RepID=A0A2Z7CHA9_9LAMI|nr:hypothetical protein F511_11349 [Dorcoceras hygrometricum]
MSLTLYDIYLFTGLPLIGPDSPYLIDDPAAPKLAPMRYCYHSYRAVVKQYEDSPEDPTETEHIYVFVGAHRSVCFLSYLREAFR